MTQKINSKELLYPQGGNDECFTPDYGVKPILKYIPKGAVVWCPFDNKDSEFVKQISKTNVVIFSHIDEGKDFFKYQPVQWDVLISNPPFTAKRKFFERALSFNKPFALIMSNTWLNDAAPKQLFMNKELQLLMFDKRMKFKNAEGITVDKITFSSSYYCHKFLPKQLIMEELFPKTPKVILEPAKQKASILDWISTIYKLYFKKKNP